MTLKECCIMLNDGNWIESKDQSPNGIRLIQTGNIGNGEYLNKDNRAKYISEETFDKLNCTEVFPGDILVSRLPDPVGRACIVPDNSERMITAVDCSILRVNEEIIYRRFLLHYLKSPTYFNQLTGKLAGTTRTRISRKNLETVTINVPSFQIQSEVVDILDHVESVITNRKKELCAFDNLIKARFVEMFGDPLNGTAKWPFNTVGDVAESVDPQPSHRTPPIDADGIPYISIKDCDYKTGEINFDGARKVSRDVLEEHRKRYNLHDGDFIIGKIGTVGNPIFVPARHDYTLSANIVLIQPEQSKVSPYYLKYSFMSAYIDRQFEEAKNSTSQAAFGIQKVRQIKVMNPDLKEQYRFEEFARQVDKSKFEILSFLLLSLQISLEKVIMLA